MSTDPLDVGNVIPLYRPESHVPGGSWLDVVGRRIPLINEVTRQMLPLSVQLVSSPGGVATTAHVLSFDLGNDAAKLGMLGTKHTFVSVRIPTAYQSVGENIKHGSGRTSYRIATDGDGEVFWVGGDAGAGASALPLGNTAARLTEDRYKRFARAAMVRLLSEAGYEPGAYTLVVGLGIRNEEIAEVEGRQQLEPATRAAIRALRDPFTVTQTIGGVEHEWRITVAVFYPAAQTLGTFFAWHYKPSGQPSQRDIRRLAILDYGGGDTHLLQVEWLGDHMTVTGERLGDGTIEIASALIEAIKRDYHGLTLTTSQAQQTLVLGDITVKGRAVNITPLIEKIKRSRVENMLGRAMTILQDESVYLIHTGGGAALIAPEIEERMAVVKRTSHDYLVVAPGLAALSNCIGLWAFTYNRLLVASTTGRA